jgi:hypothetical protein
MANIKWSAFPTQATPVAGDKLVGLHSGANVQFSSLGAVLLAPTGAQTISGGFDLIVSGGGNLQASSGNLVGGSSGFAGNAILFPPTSGMGILEVHASDSAAMYTGLLTNTSLSSGQTWTLPDATGTIALTSGASGIVNSGLINQLAYYATAGTTVSGLTIANQAVLTTNGTGVPAWSALSSGQILVGTSSGAPSATAINSGTGILVANGSGSITINATGGGTGWVGIAGTTQTAAINTGYVILNSSLTTIMLPSTAPFGSVVRVVGFGAAGWVLTPNSGQTIRLLSTVAPVSIASAEQYDCIEVISAIPNNTWVVRNFTSTGLVIT